MSSATTATRTAVDETTVADEGDDVTEQAEDTADAEETTVDLEGDPLDAVDPYDGPVRPAGSPGVLLAVRLLAVLALAVTAALHAREAVAAGLGGPVLSRGHLLALDAVLVGLLALALLARDRLWTAAVLLSVTGLAAIVASVYFSPPAIDEPVWLLTKAVCALTQLTVVTLWLIRRIAPPSR